MDRVDDLLDGDDSGDQDTPSQDNRSAAQTRLDREKQKLLKEVEELRAWRAEREQVDRRNTLAQTFGELGLNPKHAEFYNGEEVSPDAIRAWAVEKDFISADALEAPEPPATGYTPTVITDPKTLGSRNYSVSEWKELARTNPDLAQRLHAEGRVDLAGLRVGLGPDR